MNLVARLDGSQRPRARRLASNRYSIQRQRLIDVEIHWAVTAWELGIPTEAGLVQAQAVAIDATTLEANRAM